MTGSKLLAENLKLLAGKLNRKRQVRARQVRAS
jgi:hypothetical protein